MNKLFVILFFNISGGEIFIILLIVFIVFGPSKMPELARSLGRMMNEAKKASSDISKEFKKQTSAIERDFTKTANDLTKETMPLEESKKRRYESGEENIPDIYPKDGNQEIESSEKPDEGEKKTGKNIQ